MNKLIIRFWVFGICCLVFGIAADAQTWQWGRRGGGNNGINPENEKVIDMATDKNGNLYLLAQLGGGGDATLGTENGDSLLATRLYGGKDVALISYDCSGKLRWTKIFGCQYEDYAAGMSMDTLGHIYVAMNVNSIGGLYIDIDSFSSNINRKSMVLIQYDTAGDFKWLRQPNPDTTSALKNISEYGCGPIVAMPNGETYMMCLLGTGLISGSTNLVATTSGYYMLKYNVAGVPKELIKVDMTQANNGFFSYTNFSVTNSRKFIFTGRRNNGSSQTSYPIVGGQFVKHPIFLCCFSQTGNVLWRIEDKDTIGGSISGRPQIDETKGLIYVGGYANGVYGDTIQNFVIKNSFTSLFFRGVPFIMAIDTLGVVNLLKNGNTYEISGLINDLTFRSDGRLFAFGFGGSVEWGSFKFDGGGNKGYQTFMPSFNATTGTVLSMDSLLGSADATYASVMTADNKNNIYVAGEMTYDVKVGSQTLVSNCGVTDFFVAKYGSANCGVVPLTMMSYQLLMINEKQVVNQWTTASEVNVSRFNVQRSIDGKSFENIGVVMARNKSLNEYNFIDPLTTINLPLNLYYRIESIDFDGNKQYSEIRSVELSIRNGAISVYPNPARDMVHIECNAGIKQLLITDYLGKQAYKQIATGTNLRNDVHTVNTKQLTKGIYIVQVTTTKGNVLNEKLIIE